MPLHLLGKKSWNVYNVDNIEKVRRDEARAKAQEDADDERKQEIDAQRRLQILRGEVLTPILDVDVKEDTSERARPSRYSDQRKRRKRNGEDDTDFEMRLVHERSENDRSHVKSISRKPDIDAPLVDRQGHIDLFPQEKPSRETEKAVEAAKELDKKKKEYADNYTVKFSDAAGFKQSLQNPWYSRQGEKADDADMPTKDAWGNDDPRRKEREATRIVSNDPLAMMKQGAASARRHDRERKLWLEEQEHKLHELKRDQRAERGKRKRRHESDEDTLNDFTLHDREQRLKYRRHDSKPRESHESSRDNKVRPDDKSSKHSCRHRDH